MVHIILMILKIIGILLAILLGLILLLIGIVLFVPVRYRAAVDKNEELIGSARASWLFHALEITADYQKKSFRAKGRFLWIKLFDSAEEETEEAEEADSSKNSAGDLKKTDSSLNSAGDTKLENSVDTKDEFDEYRTVDSEEKYTADKITENTAGKIESNFSEETDTSKKQKSSLNEKLQSTFKKLAAQIKGFFQTTKQKLLHLKKTAEDLKSKLDYYKRLWYDNYTQETIRHVKKESTYLLHHYLPKKISGDVLFGMEDPAQTGQILGVLSVLQGFSGNDQLFVDADFENKCLEGNASLKGHIRLCHLLKAGLALLLDKHCRITISRVRRLLIK